MVKLNFGEGVARDLSNPEALGSATLWFCLTNSNGLFTEGTENAMQYSLSGLYGLPVLGHTCGTQKAQAGLPKLSSHRAGDAGLNSDLEDAFRMPVSQVLQAVQGILSDGPDLPSTRSSRKLRQSSISSPILGSPSKLQL